MAASVARQKSYGLAGQRAQNVIVGWPPEWRVNAGLFLGFKSRHGIETAAADDSDFRFQLSFS
jgi:hypothetical protein